MECAGEPAGAKMLVEPLPLPESDCAGRLNQT
jgi:hypothetical protein